MVNVVVPMAGRGSRFLVESFRNPEYKKPKPLIEIEGKKMVEWALSSYPLAPEDNLMFLVLEKHIKEDEIDIKLKEVFGEKISIIPISAVTEGAACTALLAKRFIDNDQPLLITDSDHYIDGKTFFKDIENNEKIDGMIPVCYANNSKYSFSKTDQEGRVIEVAEKVQISRNANIGAYYFRKGRDFVWAAEEMIDENDRTNGEFYVAPVYNYLIRRGKNVKLSRPNFIHNLGTPKDLEKFLKFLSHGEIPLNFSSGKMKKSLERERGINVVIPLAGKDNRFNEYGDVKPLIKIGDKPLIKHCTDSLDFFKKKHNLYFILLKEQEIKYKMKERLEELYSSKHNLHFLILDEMTEGAASTVLKLKENINDDKKLVIYLADIYFESDINKRIEEESADGLVPTFKTKNPKCSYLKLENPIDMNSKVIQVAEKEIISDNGSAGFYYFKRGRDFVWAAEEMIKKERRVNDSFYICPVYQELVEAGKMVKAVQSKFKFGLGSPEEVNLFKDRFLKK